MSTLSFSHSNHLLTHTDDKTFHVTQFVAYNNVDSHSQGPWPVGTFTFSWFRKPAPEDTITGPYGSHGLLIFNVAARTGMAIHAGREGVPDGLGREGPQHCTMGCIRIADHDMVNLLLLHHANPVEILTVTD